MAADVCIVHQEHAFIDAVTNHVHCQGFPQVFLSDFHHWHLFLKQCSENPKIPAYSDQTDVVVFGPEHLRMRQD